MKINECVFCSEKFDSTSFSNFYVRKIIFYLDGIFQFFAPLAFTGQLDFELFAAFEDRVHKFLIYRSVSPAASLRHV